MLSLASQNQLQDMFYSHLLLISLLLPAAFAQDENPVACLQSGACFQVGERAPICNLHSSFTPVAGLLWHHLFWTPVCLLSRNPLCRATNRKSEVSDDIFPTSLYHSGFLRLSLTSLKRVFGMFPQSQRLSVPKRPLGTTHGKLSAMKIASS